MQHRSSRIRGVRKRTSAATGLAALVLAGACLSIASGTAQAEVGEYHVYSCRTPSGAPAPTAGWSGSIEGQFDAATNTCPGGGGMVAGLEGGVTHPSTADLASWTFTAPTGEVIADATLWRAGSTAGGNAEGAGYEYYLTSGGAGGESAQIFESCKATQKCEEVGDLDETRVPANELVVPPSALGTSSLSLTTACGSLYRHDCPAGTAGEYDAEIELFAADIVLDQTQGPTVTNVEGPLASAPSLSGMEEASFTATDPGSGIYQAQVSVDGLQIKSMSLDEEGGTCRDLGETTDGLPAFLATQPCAPTLTSDVGLNTSELSNGTHQLLVTVSDAAGRKATVLERTITIANQAPGGKEEATEGPTGQEAQPGDEGSGTEEPAEADGGERTGPAESTPGTEAGATGGDGTIVPGAGIPAGEAPPAAAPLTVPTPLAVTPVEAETTPAAKSATASRGAPNGRNASDRAKLTAAWRGGGARLESAFGRSHEVRGRLVASGGKPIAGARIEVRERPDYEGAKPRTLARARTDAKGRWQVKVPASVPSSSLSFEYRSHLGDEKAAARAGLRLAVRAGIRLRITPRISSVGHRISFHGSLLGGPLPHGGKQLVLEARSPGGRWIEFNVVRSGPGGRFHASYRFHLAGPEHYEFRVLCKYEADFPYESGASKVVKVTER